MASFFKKPNILPEVNKLGKVGQTTFGKVGQTTFGKVGQTTFGKVGQNAGDENVNPNSYTR